MEKRVIIFAALAMAILLGYQALETRLHPPAEPQQVADDAVVPDAAGQAAVDARPNQAGPTDVDTNAAANNLAEIQPDNLEPIEALEAGDETTRAEEAGARWITLGSLDKNRPEKMLVWFTNQGAAIECIALNDPRYTDLDVRHGYLGYLALRDTSHGCQIGAVGNGTPAGLAVPSNSSQPIGLMAGDVLEQIGEMPIPDRAAFAAWIETTRPSEEVRLRIRREQAGEWMTLEYVATLDKRPLEVIRPEPEVPSATDPAHPLSYLLGIQQLGDETADFTDDELTANGLPSLKTGLWEARQIDVNGSPGVEFHFVLTSAQLEPFGLTGPLRVIKRYSLGQPNEEDPRPGARFHLNYEIIFRNEAPDGEPIRLSYQQNGPNGLPLEGWWYTYKTHPRNYGGAGVRDIVFKVVDGRHEMFTNPKIIDRIGEPNPMTLMFESGNAPVLDYIGVDSQYFLSALLPDPAEFDASPLSYQMQDAMALAVSGKDPVKASRTNVSFRIIMPSQTIGPQQQASQRYLIFAGPKQPDVLKQYGMEECITYGWFRIVAKPLQWVLHAFHRVFRNYGIAIILLTVLVRGLMFPIGRQQVVNAQKMQELAPEMRRIADQYKTDMEKRAAAQRELFRKHNYNPMAGCLPMFFQLPIFIGLYRALSVDIELRQAPLIPGLHWCSNLAGPDQLLFWENFMPSFLASRTGWLGPYLNILPLISVAFMMVHQKLFTPPPTDEQQEMQQRMMKFMMLFFALMFFRVPAGLCLYFITSSAWGLAERKLLPNKNATTATVSGDEPKGGLLTKLLAGVSNGSKATPPPNKRRSKSKRR